MKVLPPMTFEQALRAGYTGRIVCKPYLQWLKTLPCDTCGAPPPSDPSHLNAWKGMGTKSPDLFAIPECRECNRKYDTQPSDEDRRIRRAAFYLLRAFWEGHFVWKKKGLP